MSIIILILLGLCFGSFVNALVWRLHEQTKPKSKQTTDNLSILKGRSMCSQCHHPLAVVDLIPVLSWVWLRGRCRYCHKKIADSPLIEMGTALLFISSYIWWPMPFSPRQFVLFGLWLAFLIVCMALIAYDLKWMLLPNRLVYALGGLAVLQILVAAIWLHGGLRGIGAAFLGALVGGGLFYLIFQLSNGRWIGGGDVKLGLVLGLVLGDPVQAFMMLFVASLLGLAVSLPLLLSRRLRRNSRIPFGPFLIGGTIIVRLFGAAIFTWYTHKLLLL